MNVLYFGHVEFKVQSKSKAKPDVHAQAFAKEIARSVSQVLDAFPDGDSGGIRENCGTQLSLDYVPQDLSGHVTSSILRLVSRRHFSFELCFRTRTVGENHEVL